MGCAKLAAAAFGGRPDCPLGDLPAARTDWERWLSAVVLGGQGRYAAGRAELTRIRHRTSDPVVSAALDTTWASWCRQLGWHDIAARFDGRAAGLLLPMVSDRRGRVRGETDSAREAAVPEAGDIVCDALIGLAADAVGTGRITLARRLLARARPWAVCWRTRVRLGWVETEVALASEQYSAALQAARRAADQAAAAPSRRHRLKSQLLLAAATSVAGNREAAATLAQTVTREARELDLLPLYWASVMLRQTITPSADEARGIAKELAGVRAEICRRGGVFRVGSPPRN